METEGVTLGFHRLLEALEISIVQHADQSYQAASSGDAPRKAALDQQISWLEGFHSTLAQMEESWKQGSPVKSIPSRHSAYPPLRVMAHPEAAPDRFLTK